MTERIAHIALDEASVSRRSQEAEHERQVAMADLMGDNQFEPAGMQSGPYDVLLRIEEGRLIFDITSRQADKKTKVALSVAPLRAIIRDYFLICESYYEALKTPGPAKIEAIDMGRRGIHNEGSQLLQELLQGKITVDFQTARRLFTLICVLHIRQ
jgi:uncharacterized protein (UPF0262 family)